MRCIRRRWRRQLRARLSRRAPRQTKPRGRISRRWRSSLVEAEAKADWLDKMGRSWIGWFPAAYKGGTPNLSAAAKNMEKSSLRQLLFGMSILLAHFASGQELKQADTLSPGDLGIKKYTFEAQAPEGSVVVFREEEYRDDR